MLALNVNFLLQGHRQMLLTKEDGT